MKKTIKCQFILLIAFLFIKYLSLAGSNLYIKNNIPAEEKTGTSLSDDIPSNTVGKNTIFILTTNEGADCGCTTVGNFVNPDKGFPQTVKADYTSPKGKYKLSIGGSGPYTLYVKLVSNNITVYQTTVPGGQWGFSPDDDRFLTTYLSSGIQMSRLVDLSTAPATQVWSSQVLTGSSRLQFSPNGDYLMYNAITAPSHTMINIIDTRSGRIVYQNEFTFQPIPDDPGETHGMVTWGFSPDLSSRTFVYAYVSGQSNVNFIMVNLETRLIVKSTTITSGSAYWQFSPCGDVLGIVQQSSPTQILAQLYKTVSIQTILAEQSHTFISPVVLSTTGSSHIITIGGTQYTLADNTAATPCSNEFVSVTVPDTLTGGFKGTGTVRLNNPATGSAVVVSLSSNHPELASVPSSVTIPIGIKTNTFTIQSNVVQSDSPVVITATGNSVTRKDTMILRALKIKSLQLPDTVAGGSTVYGDVTLNDIAPSAGIPVTLECDKPSVAPVQTGFTITSGNKTKNFGIKTNPVIDFTRVTITARTSNSEKSKVMIIRPPFLDSIRISPSTIKGGNPVTLFIWFNGYAPLGDSLIILSSSNPDIASLAGTAIIRVNEKSTSIPITTKGVASEVSVAFNASYRGKTLTKSLVIRPADLSSVLRNPCAVCGMTGGGSTDITINLDGEAPPGGAVISLSSNNTSLIIPPPTATVPAGLRSIIAPLNTSSVPANTTVRITAQYRSSMIPVDIVLGAAGKYSVTDLGIPTGFIFTNGIAINDSNAVLVHVYGGTSPEKTSFLWRNGVKTYFPLPPYYLGGYIMAGDINDNSHVTGVYGTASLNEKAILWIDGVTSLLPISAYRSSGWKINGSDWIIGEMDGQEDGQDFLFKNGNMSSLLNSIPGATRIRLQDINNKGQVILTANIDAGAFFWDNGIVSEIKSTVSGYYTESLHALNDSGLVVGNLRRNNPLTINAFIWRDSIIKILPLPTGYRDIYARHINNKKDIVGYLMKQTAGGGFSYHGMLYHDGSVYNLNELIPDPARCTFNDAAGINNHGLIIGTGMINGETRAMLLVPPDDLPTGIRPEKTKANVHLLGQNFPNPFKSSTTIPYFLPEAVHVRLTIIDMMGREVRILTDEMQPAGDRYAEFRAENLPGGIYFYCLKAGISTEVKRLLLLK
ncbi:MAG TPA: hypothetical protein DDW27_00505 [Bacteroidales bacterium]|nr:hypothetical protein [Bacteroidales bacterium]